MSGQQDTQGPYFPEIENDRRIVIETETMYRELVESGAMSVDQLQETILDICNDELTMQLGALEDLKKLREKVEYGELGDKSEVVDFEKYLKKGKKDAQH